MRINNDEISYTNRPYVIAEAGDNHTGDIDRAIALVDAAAAAGADAVKFQTFSADRLVTPDAPVAPYQRAQTCAQTQASMLRDLELSAADHERLLPRATSQTSTSCRRRSTPRARTCWTALSAAALNAVKSRSRVFSE